MRQSTAILLLASLVASTSVGTVFADTSAGDPTPDVGVMSAVDVERELDRVTRDLKTVDTEIERAKSTAETARKRTAARGRAYYRQVHAGLLPVGSGFEALVSHATRAERLRRAIERDIALIKELDERRVALLAKREKLTAKKGPLEMQHQAMAQARAALQEADDRRRSFDRAFASSSGADYLAIYGGTSMGNGPAAAEPPGNAQDTFRTMKGRLPFPLAGRAEVRVVNRPGAGGSGVEMRAPVGTPVRAIFPGRVAFADEYATYGKVVILDHGDHYFTVSGNLGSVEVRVGEEVGTGNRIGTVGATQGRGVLYFEVRQGADTLDPTPWFGL